jgi:hypothetical protein
MHVRGAAFYVVVGHASMLLTLICFRMDSMRHMHAYQ